MRKRTAESDRVDVKRRKFFLGPSMSSERVTYFTFFFTDF
jgi:hypothetical protein